MPNFPLAISRAGNSNIVHRCLANTVPRFALSPKLSWTQKITARQLALVPTTQVITLLVGGTASDGTYELTFTGGGLTAPVVVSAERDSGQTSAQMAAELEAEIEATRADELAGVVVNESVNSATITITCLAKASNVASVNVAVSFPGSATGTLTYTYAATLDAATSIDGERISHDFETNVIRTACVLHRRVAFAGVTTITMIAGDANDDNGLLTSTSLATTGFVQTTGANEFVRRQEAAFVPQWVVTTSGATPMPFQSLTAGEAELEIHYFPIPQV